MATIQITHFDQLGTICNDYSQEYRITGSGRGSRIAGFDAPFNMGSARCKIEWNDNFEATYLKN